MQLVVVMAVRKAVSAATITFTAISIRRVFFIVVANFRGSKFFTLHSSLFTFLISVTVARYFTAATGVATRVTAGITARVFTSGVRAGA